MNGHVGMAEDGSVYVVLDEDVTMIEEQVAEAAAGFRTWLNRRIDAVVEELR